MNDLHPDSTDDYCAEAFRERLQRMWFALEDEGLSPAPMIAQWSGKKKSTIYKWKNGENVPSDPWTVMRLAKNAAEDGYPQILDLIIPGRYDLVERGEARVTHTVVDDISEIDHDEAELWDAYRAGNGDKVVEIGKHLKQKGEDIVAEGKQMASDAANGRTD